MNPPTFTTPAMCASPTGGGFLATPAPGRSGPEVDGDLADAADLSGRHPTASTACLWSLSGPARRAPGRGCPRGLARQGSHDFVSYPWSGSAKLGQPVGQGHHRWSGRCNADYVKKASGTSGMGTEAAMKGIGDDPADTGSVVGRPAPAGGDGVGHVQRQCRCVVIVGRSHCGASISVDWTPSRSDSCSI